MLNKQKTREGLGGFAGSEMMFMAEQEDSTRFPLVPQGKCARCPYSPGNGEACHLPFCPFTEPVPQGCSSCRYVRQVPLRGGRARKFCIFTGEKLSAGGEPFCEFRQVEGGEA